MCILDLSKHLMYNFYYSNLKKYGDKCNLLCTDTDSLILEIKTEDVYKDMANDKYNYDFSNYPVNHPLYSNNNNNNNYTFILRSFHTINDQKRITKTKL